MAVSPRLLLLCVCAVAVAFLLPGCRAPGSPEGGDPVPFKARGNEPGWLLTMTDDRMRLEYAYGTKQAHAPRPQPAATPDGYRYVAAAGEHELHVRIRERLCTDSMSGMYYPTAVTVQVDGETLSGCGGDPAELLTGGTWVVEDLAGRGVIDASRMTLRFRPDGRLAGRASCNRYTASYVLTGALEIDAVAGTDKSCAPALMNQEQLFLHLLRDVRRFAITDTGALRLVTTGGQAVTARRRTPLGTPGR